MNPAAVFVLLLRSGPRALRVFQVLASFLVFAAILPRTSGADTPWRPLLDEKLSQWDTYLSYRHVPTYNGTQPRDAQGNLVEPVGLNRDEAKVFSVAAERGRPILRISGEIYGCLVSKEEFGNYRLRLKVKWGDRRWPPRTDKLRDSGICYHSIGPMGVDYWRAWMLSHEFQIMDGHMGDYWPLAGSAIDIRAYLPEGGMNAIADTRQPFLPFGPKPGLANFCLRQENFEKQLHEWNEVELICFEDKALHVVNGHVVMVLRNSRYRDAEGKLLPLTRGKIQLQSEATEVFYRDIRLQRISALPKEYESLFQ